MYVRQIERAGDVDLRDGQHVAMMLGQPDGLEFDIHLAKQLRDRLVCRPTAHPDHPLLEDGTVDQGITPERRRDAGIPCLAALGYLCRSLNRGRGIIEKSTWTRLNSADSYYFII